MSLVQAARFLYCLFGGGTVHDGLVCRVSRNYTAFDMHDYHIPKGGDGIPTHFHQYECWVCGKHFYI